MGEMNQSLMPEKRSNSWAETVRYNDGQLSLEFRNERDRVNLGLHGYGDVHDCDDNKMAVIETMDGEVYALSRGVGVNTQEETAFPLPYDLPEIIVGEPWRIPEVVDTYKVESVSLRYEVDHNFSSSVARESDKTNPFDQYNDLIGQAAEKLLILQQ